MNRTTNVEFVTELMEYSNHGVFMQAFILEALDNYTQRVLASPPLPESSLIPDAVWRGCAEELQTKLKERYAPESNTPGTP